MTLSAVSGLAPVQSGADSSIPGPAAEQPSGEFGQLTSRLLASEGWHTSQV